MDLMYEKMIRDRLDKFTRREWDLHINTHKPTFNELCTFLEGRHKSVKYTASESSIPASASKYQQGNKQNRKSLLSNNKPVNFVCTICSQNHLISNCPSFIKENIEEPTRFMNPGLVTYVKVDLIFVLNVSGTVRRFLRSNY